MPTDVIRLFCDWGRTEKRKQMKETARAAHGFPRRPGARQARLGRRAAAALGVPGLEGQAAPLRRHLLQPAHRPAAHRRRLLSQSRRR